MTAEFASWQWAFRGGTVGVVIMGSLSVWEDKKKRPTETVTANKRTRSTVLVIVSSILSKSSAIFPTNFADSLKPYGSKASPL